MSHKWDIPFHFSLLENFYVSSCVFSIKWHFKAYELDFNLLIGLVRRGMYPHTWSCECASIKP